MNTYWAFTLLMITLNSILQLFAVKVIKIKFSQIKSREFVSLKNVPKSCHFKLTRIISRFTTIPNFFLLHLIRRGLLFQRIYIFFEQIELIKYQIYLCREKRLILTANKYFKSHKFNLFFFCYRVQKSKSSACISCQRIFIFQKFYRKRSTIRINTKLIGVVNIIDCFSNKNNSNVYSLLFFTSQKLRVVKLFEADSRKFYDLPLVVVKTEVRKYSTSKKYICCRD